jgi:NAD(P)-dependent dehydrogenase (short-subunit alcohol dehydrogenase family)
MDRAPHAPLALDRDLSGQTVLVCGATGTLGAAIARELASRGADVALHCNQNVQAAEVLRDALSRGRHAVVAGNLSSLATAKAVVEQAANGTGRPPSVIVDAAFPSVSPRAVVEITDEDVELHLDGFRMHVNICRAAVPAMREAGYGRIILISGALAMRNFDGFALFAAAKSGLTSFSRTLALEEGKHGITVNSVAPGRVTEDEEGQGTETAMLPERFARLETVMQLRRALPRYATPSDVAHVAAFFASPRSGAVTAQVVYLAAGEPI